MSKSKLKRREEMHRDENCSHNLHALAKEDRAHGLYTTSENSRRKQANNNQCTGQSFNNQEVVGSVCL